MQSNSIPEPEKVELKKEEPKNETIGVIENITTANTVKEDEIIAQPEANVITDDEDLFNPVMQQEIAAENEVEFEINLKVPEFDIQIVDKPRVHLLSDEEEEAKTHTSSLVDTQFTLFETVNNKIAEEEMDDQVLERDLIKKRITLDMEKHHISLYELEKEPAYKRYGMELDNNTPSDESNFSNYMIYNNSEDPTKIEIRPNAMKDITLD